MPLPVTPTDTVWLCDVREGHRAGAAIVEPVHREGDGSRLGIVDDVIGGVGHHQRRHLGLVGVQGDGIAGGACWIAVRRQ